MIFKKCIMALLLVFILDTSASDSAKIWNDFKTEYLESCDDGYPFYSWVVSGDSVLKKVQGGYWQVGKPVVLGSSVWDDKVFEHLLNLPAGQAYQCANLETSKVLLREFSGVSVLRGPLLYKHFNKRHLIPVWQVEDKKTNSLSLSINAGDGDWGGLGDFFLGRIWGYPRELLLRFNKFNDVQEYAMMYKEPWVFDSPLDLRFKTGLEAVDSISFWVGAVLELEGDIGHLLNWSAGVDAELERWLDIDFGSKYLERWGLPWALGYKDEIGFSRVNLALYGGYFSNLIPNEKVISYREWGVGLKLNQSFGAFGFNQKISHEFIDSPPEKLSPNEGFDPRHENWSPRGLPMLRMRALEQSFVSFELSYLLESAGLGFFHDFYHAEFVRPYRLYSYGPFMFTKSSKSPVEWNLYLAWTYEMSNVLEGRLGFRMKYLF